MFTPFRPLGGSKPGRSDAAGFSRFRVPARHLLDILNFLNLFPPVLPSPWGRGAGVRGFGAGWFAPSAVLLLRAPHRLTPTPLPRGEGLTWSPPPQAGRLAVSWMSISASSWMSWL